MSTIYYNGDIITMESNVFPEAILEKNGIIAHVGNLKDCEAISPNAKKMDLCKRTLLPAFIDAHGHFSGAAYSFLSVQLSECQSVNDIIEKIQRYITDNNIENGEWVIAEGYDHNKLIEQRHPQKDELNIFKDNPILIKHQSGHMGIINEYAANLLETFNSSGYFEEDEYMAIIRKIPIVTSEKLFSAIKKAEQRYFSYGIATAQEGFLTEKLQAFYKSALLKNTFSIDIIAYSEASQFDKAKKEFANSFLKYYNHFKLAGVKIFLDGSPQAKTAWFSTPYKNSENCGVALRANKEVINTIKFAIDNNVQLLAHCNGDAACKQFIDAIELLYDRGENISLSNPVIIHAQFLNIKEMKRVKKLGVIPSFFVSHAFYWGDTHIKNLGIERASMLSPVNTAARNGINFTLHQDSPVLMPSILEAVWCAVNRKTENGKILGSKQRISILDALRGVTINAAMQYGEENIKGSIKEGKEASFVVLDKNPLKIDFKEIKDIIVCETIISGKSVYRH